MKNVPVFEGFGRPSSDFASVRSELRAPPQYFEVDLGTARSLAAGTAARFTRAGNVLYIDQKRDTGFATIHVQDDARAGNTPITVFAGFISRIPFTELILENDAQPGMVMRIIYGTDLDFVPSLAAGVNVLNAINVNDTIDPACQFLPVAMPVGIGANQVTPMLLPAANPRGVVLRSLYHAVTAGGGGNIGSNVIAASAAPVTSNTAQANAILLSGLVDSGAAPRIVYYTFNRRLPAGWGIWNISSIGVADATNHAANVSIEVY